jgi:integrase/recombinase XerC
MDMSDAVRQFLTHKRLSGRDSETLLQYQGHLERWAAWRQAQNQGTALGAVVFAEVAAFFAYLATEATTARGARRGQAGLAPRTQRAYHRTLSAFWRWLRTQPGALAVEQLYYFDRGMLPIPAPVERERPAITEAQFMALLAAAAGDDEEAARNVLILWLLWDTGARVHELAGLSQADVDLAGMSARVVGKGADGGKEGVVFWTPRTAAALRAYLRVRRGPLQGPLLRGVNSRNQGAGCTSNLIRCMVKRLAKRAGVQLPNGSPCHAFRHAFARRMRAAGLTTEEVGELLRDTTPAVIAQYLGLDIEPRRRLYRQANGMGATVVAPRRSAEG